MRKLTPLCVGLLSILLSSTTLQAKASFASSSSIAVVIELEQSDIDGILTAASKLLRIPVLELQQGYVRGIVTITPAGDDHFIVNAGGLSVGVDWDCH